MVKNLKFYKDFDLWFYENEEYLQSGGSLADLQMVEGADIWLDELSEGGEEINLQVGFGERIKEEEGRLLNIDVNSNERGYYLVYPDNHKLWLCPVLEWLCGEYPDIIYYKILK